LQNIDKFYKTAVGDFPALKDINLQIDEGEFVSIIGKSGSGKSTLLNMITGIDRPTTGEVWVNGTAVHELNENQLAGWRGENLGIIFQFFQLLPALSILQNVILPMDLSGKFSPRERRERAQYLLELVGLADHQSKLPSMVSGGQQQRAAMARALANDPPIVIADEPTGNLDTKTAETVFKLFNELVAQGKTVIIVTHDSSLARRAHRTALITDGEIVNEFVAKALPTLTHDQLLAATHRVTPRHYEPGAMILTEGKDNDKILYRLQRHGGSRLAASQPVRCGHPAAWTGQILWRDCLLPRAEEHSFRPRCRKQRGRGAVHHLRPAQRFAETVRCYARGAAPGGRPARAGKHPVAEREGLRWASSGTKSGSICGTTRLARCWRC
jgi:ABC-type lipoprotein export system ATPase subunit